MRPHPDRTVTKFLTRSRVPAWRARQAGVRAVWSATLLVLAACGDSTTSPTTGGVDLDRLFAEPTSAELNAVVADWASRTPRAEDVVVEATQPFLLGGTIVELQIVSHVMDGARHYGAVFSPLQPMGSLPLLLYLHGGDDGVSVEEMVLVAAGAGVDPNRVVWVVPSFRSEPLRAGSQTWRSGGTPSPWDRDVDDTLALLDAAASLVPAADRECVGAVGLSRGGGVALLLSARDPRVRATIDFFGPTDFFSTWVRDIAADALRDRPTSLPGLRYMNEAWLQPLRRGEVGYTEARLALLRRSPAHFASRLGPVQAHHGTADDVVPVSQTQALIDAMAGIGRGAPDFEAYLYPGVGHNVFVMAGAPERSARFLAGLAAACGG